MVEESIDIPVTPETVEPKDGLMRRSSTGRTSTSKSGEKLLPHYLRASAGSCHDFCKYGRKHAFEAKGKHPILKGKTTTSNEDLNLIKSANPRMSKKKPVVKPMPSPDPEWICDTSSEGLNPVKSVTQRMRKKKPVVKPMPSDPETQICDTSSEGLNPVKSVTQQMRKKKPAVKPKSSPDPETWICDTSSEGLNPEKSVTQQMRKKKPVIKPKSSPGPEIQMYDKPKINKQETQLFKQKASLPAKKIDHGAKSAISFKPKPITEKLLSFPVNPPKDLRGRRNSSAKNSETSRIGQKKAVVLPKTTLYPKPSFNRVKSLNTRKYRILKGASPTKNQNKVREDESKLPNDEKVSEKTLYVIEPKPESKSMDLTADYILASLSSPLSPSFPPYPSLELHEEVEYVESEYDETETDSEYDESETESKYAETETLKEEYKRRHRRAAMVHPEETVPAYKVRFRRGKVVDLQSENDGPRRLRFRRGRVLGDEQNGKGDIRKRNFRRREVDDSNTTGANPESEQVVLRHQDVNGRKDAQGLFNNVIEETASKLVEARKSKVKALVGAFETVISLQESKPSASSLG